MIISKYYLDRNAFFNLKIRDIYSIHKVVYSLFPQERGRGRDFLFVEAIPEMNYKVILILSESYPEKPLYGRIESKVIPESFLDYDHYQFNIKINSVKKNFESGKRYPVKGIENLNNWFKKKMYRDGIEIKEELLEIVPLNSVKFEKEGNQIVISATTFKGVLKVIDRDKFRESFKKGFGKNKAFGFGLLQLQPIIF